MTDQTRPDELIIEFPPDVPMRWVGFRGRPAGELATALRRRGWIVQVIGNVVRLVIRPSVKGW